MHITVKRDNTSVSSTICHNTARYYCTEDTPRTIGLSCDRTITKKHIKTLRFDHISPLLVIFDLAVIHKNTLYPVIFDVIQMLMYFKDGT